jgi:ATP-binding cassette subfamily F protein uup
MALLSLENVTKSYDGRTLLRGVNLTVDEGERVGLVGPNGSGKSTILRLLSGQEPPDAGTRVLRRELRLGYLEQELELDGSATVRDVVRAGLAGRARVLAELAEVHEALARGRDEDLGRLLARQGRLEQELEGCGGHDVEHALASTLQALGITDFDARCGALSGGERRRVALARRPSSPRPSSCSRPTARCGRTWSCSRRSSSSWWCSTRRRRSRTTRRRRPRRRVCCAPTCASR